MDHKRLSRRDFLRWSAVAAGTTALAACGPTTPPATEKPLEATPVPPTEKVEATAAPTEAAEPTVAPTEKVEATAPAQEAQIRFAMWDWYAYAPGIRWDEWNQNEAFPVFQADNPGITLTWEPLGDGWESKVLTQMAAGTAPDIMSVWSPILETWAEKGQLLNLQPLIDLDIPNADQLYIKAAWDQMWEPFTGTRMGMLADLDITSVYYSKPAFEEAGVPLPTVDWTVDDYTAAAQKLTKKDDSGNITRWGGELRPDFWLGYFYYVEAFGGQVRDEETRMTCLLDQPDAQAGLEWIRKGMWELNCLAQSNQMNATGVPNLWTGALPAGIVAFAERSADQFFALSDSMAEGSWDIAHIPQGPKGRACMGVPDEWVVYKGVVERGNQEAVWKVMKWLAGDWYQEKIASAAGRIPGLLSAVGKWADTLRNLDARLKAVRLEVLQEQIQMGYARRGPIFRFQQAAQELVNPALEAIYVEGKEQVSIFKDIAPKVTKAQQEALARAGG